MLTSQQHEAAILIDEWFHTYKTTNKQIFSLAGFAGTGKTYLLNHVIHNVLQLSNNSVAFIAPTGKAASVLIQKGCPATTIHRLIYTPVEHDLSTVINGKTINAKKIDFVKRSNIGNYKLIILDEVSMVNEKTLNDLLSFGIPILASGDIGQLPPIGSEMLDLLNNPDYVLTEIVRQAEDNQILQVATMARNGEYIPFGQYGEDVTVIDRQMLTDSVFAKYLLEADQVICGKNATKVKLNKYIRQLKGFNDKVLCDGEKLICELNNYEIEFDEYCLVNGMSGYASNFNIIDDDLKLATISFRPDFLDKTIDNILIEYGIFQDGEYLYDKHQYIYFMWDGTYRLQKQMFKYSKDQDKEAYTKMLREEFLNKKRAIATFMLNQFAYGYAISCHKSQGSQWDTVVLIDESKTFGQDSSKWLYTGITRAAKKLIIIR